MGSRWGRPASAGGDDSGDGAAVPRRGPALRVPGIGTPLQSSYRGRATSGHDTADDTADDAVERPADAATASADAAPAPPGLDFDGFFRAQYPSVVRLSYSLCGSMSVAEELAQEAFIAAHRRWRRIESFDRPDLWVRRVVINRSISHRRREASERKAFQRLRGRPSEHVEPVLADEEVWRALRQLSPRQAEVLALFYVEDQPISAVAEIVGVSEETVRTHLKRGRAALAARLGEEVDP